MQKTKPSEIGNTDYIAVYESSIKQVVAACGSKESANKMLGELQDHYQSTSREIVALEKKHGSGTEEFRKEKDRRLQVAKYELHKIVEKHVPHASWHLEELIMGASLAVTATLIPASQATSTLIAATGIVAIGGSYYIGFKLLKNWNVIASKHRLASFVGRGMPIRLLKGRGMPIKLLKKK